jgi:hypothetical protein
MGRVNAGYGLCSARTVKCEQRVGAPAALTLLRPMHVTLHQRRRLRYVEKDQPLWKAWSANAALTSCYN